MNRFCVWSQNLLHFVGPCIHHVAHQVSLKFLQLQWYLAPYNGLWYQSIGLVIASSLQRLKWGIIRSRKNLTRRTRRKKASWRDFCIALSTMGILLLEQRFSFYGVRSSRPSFEGIFNPWWIWKCFQICSTSGMQRQCWWQWLALSSWFVEGSSNGDLKV